MAELTVARYFRGGLAAFRCPVCNCLLEVPAPPRGARPWTADEARIRIDAQFKAHLQDRHATHQDYAAETGNDPPGQEGSPPTHLPGSVTVSAAPLFHDATSWGRAVTPQGLRRPAPD